MNNPHTINCETTIGNECDCGSVHRCKKDNCDCFPNPHPMNDWKKEFDEKMSTIWDVPFSDIGQIKFLIESVEARAREGAFQEGYDLAAKHAFEWVDVSTSLQEAADHIKDELFRPHRRD